MKKLKQCFIALMLLITCNSNSHAQDYNFQDTMNRQQLEQYLSRHMEVWFDNLNDAGMDTLRRDAFNMCVNTNLRYIAHATGMWGLEYYRIHNWGLLDNLERNVHDIDSMYADAGLVKPIIEAAIFEIVSAQVDSIEMNAETAAAFGVSQRRFKYEDMLYPSGFGLNEWDTLASIPDISRPETRMFFYHMATEYIKRGVEAIHMGQLELVEQNDVPNHDSTWALYQLIRNFAKGYNRGLVLLNADVHDKYYINGSDSTLLFDFHHAPLSPIGYDAVWADTSVYNNASINGGYNFGGPAQLTYTFCNTYGKSAGGRTHWGWYADTLPYIVAFDFSDNYDPLNQQTSCYKVWDFDDCTWYSRQTEAYRNYWLWYAMQQVKCLDRNCFLSPEGRHEYSDTAPHRPLYV